MSKLLCSIACNLDTSILQAALPLLEAEKVEAIEWSFDTTFQYETIPNWFKDLLHAFSDEQRLIGHGVFFSLFSGRWLKEQENWLIQLKKVSSEYQFDHITEHFGFMTGADFHAGAPISIPLTQTTLNLGIDRLKRIQNVCKCPVGLENLAFSVALDEVKTHGAFLNQLVESIDGFIILDLHNLYCQMHNFEIQYDEIINLYPLDKVREIHISGGSWEGVLTNPDKKIRRDTHDDCVPDVVFELLKKTIPKCPNLKYIVLEQLGTGLKTEESHFAFQQDFFKLEQIVAHFNPIFDSFPARNGKKQLFLPPLPHLLPHAPIEDHALHAQQIQLSYILENAKDYQQAKMLLQNSDLAHTAWKIEDWASEMLETALAIAQKWKVANT